VVCGPGTAKACEHAFEIGSRLKAQGRCIRYFLSATRPPGHRWEGVVMADIMRKHLLTLGVSEDEIIFREAWSFDTFGEALSLATYLDPRSQFGRIHHAVDQVYVVVKWWHAPRVWFLTRSLFPEGKKDIAVRFRVHRIQCGLLRGPLREPVAMIKAVWDIVRGRRQ